MARDLASIVKRSRREGMALHPKAHKVMVRRKNPPGFSASMRRTQTTQYGIQLREKQKVRRLYGLLERQFRRVVVDAERMSGVSGENLLQLLERRLDNVVYRLHLTTSRQAARQLVSHGHMMLNDRRVDVPSIRVRIGDKIKIRPSSQKNGYFKEAISRLKEENLPQVSWLSFDVKNLEAKVTGLPTRSEADPGINEQLIIEYYSR